MLIRTLILSSRVYKDHLRAAAELKFAVNINPDSTMVSLNESFKDLGADSAVSGRSTYLRSDITQDLPDRTQLNCLSEAGSASAIKFHIIFAPVLIHLGGGFLD